MNEQSTPRLPQAHDPSRRRFLTTTSATTAGVAVAPLFTTTVAQVQATPVAVAASTGSPAVADKKQDLGRETPVDAGQALTTNQGLKISDNQNSLRAGPRGPSLLEDQIFREKMTAFDHERIPERVVHARGAAAHGFFQVYEPLGRFTKRRVAFTH